MTGIQKKHWILSVFTLLVLGLSLANAGFPCGNCCEEGGLFGMRKSKPPMPPYDRPFPLGQVSDAFWDIQQTNAEAADFIIYDYEFVGDTATLNPLGREHMTQIARRLPHVPFPIVIEMSEKTNDPEENLRLSNLDEMRRTNVVRWLTLFYEDDPSMDKSQIFRRVVVAPDFEYQTNSSQSVENFRAATGPASARGAYGRSYGSGYGYSNFGNTTD